MTQGIRIMGIDPGFRNVGIFGCLLAFDGQLQFDFGQLIETKKGKKKLGAREKTDDMRTLAEIEAQFGQIVRAWPADVYAFEEIPNIRSSSVVRKVASAWGACHALANTRPGVLIFEYGINDLKLLTGNPKASKAEVEAHVLTQFPEFGRLKLPKKKREHVADAGAACLMASKDQAVIRLCQALARVSG